MSKPRSIFVNLPVKELEKSKDFYTKLGFSINPKFTNDDAACIVVSDIIHVMLLREEFFQTFTTKQIADAKTTTEVLVTISAESREAVNELVQKAFAAGGTKARDQEEYGTTMYGWSFQDPDGHIWEVFHMDESQKN